MKAVIISKASQKINVKLVHVTCSKCFIETLKISFKWYEHIKVFRTVNDFLHFV